jgi:hypothetical protein
VALDGVPERVGDTGVHGEQGRPPVANLKKQNMKYLYFKYRYFKPGDVG